MSNFDAMDVLGIDQASVEQSGPQYPTIQWHYGDQKMKKAGGMDYAGGFFIKGDAIDEETATAAGWQKTTWTHDAGSEEEGYYRREIAVSVIALRKRWEVVSDYQRKYFSWDKYDDAKAAGKAAGRTQALCIVKGMESVGPMVLTFKGMSGVAFEGNRQSLGALAKFAQTVITAANKASESAAKAKGVPPAKWPYRAFWLPVGADRDGKGEPVFTEVGKDKATSRVVLPAALGLPAKWTDVDLGAFYVGKELLATVNDLWAEAETNWSHAWDVIVTEVTAAEAEAAEAAAVNGAAALNSEMLAEVGL